MKRFSDRALSLANVATLSFALALTFGCDEKKSDSAAPKKELGPEKKKEVEEVEAPAPKTPPKLWIDESGPSVGFTRAMMETSDGKADPNGLLDLRKALSEAKERLGLPNLSLEVKRMAKPAWVNVYLTELYALGAKQVKIQTETRAEFPKEVTFVAPSELLSCSLTAAITKDRATAVWKVSGGTARKQARGMGGPDLTMAADAMVSTAKGCKSDAVAVGAAEGVEWGLVYDLAGAALSHEKSEIRRAALPVELTPGRPVKTSL